MGSADKATPTSDWGASAWQSLGGAIASAVKGSKTKSVGVTIADAGLVSEDTKIAAAGKIANGLLNGAYEPTRFKSKTAPTHLNSVDMLFLSSNSAAAANAAITRSVSLAKGALFTRYLVEAPPNVCTPTYLADAAAHIASASGGTMSLTVLEKEDCEKLGMGCYLGVSEASDEPPKFIHLTYTPKGQVKKKIAIVGKGLTFDSGGYNLKPTAGSLIELMKFDMGGAGATLGAARALAEIQPEGVEVHFIIASCENMVDGRGMRPGDILVAANGKTIEINNTDAEGRLTLCDALLYAQDKGAEAIVDVATLTGACIVGLGTGMAGMYASNDDMASALNEAGKITGEKLWRLPLEDSYMEQLKSPIADLKNSGGRWGGSITAALFLKEFVDTEKVSWAHLDIAGPVWDDKLGGATGYGAQLLAEWVVGQGK